MSIIFDIGMHGGEDTDFYLKKESRIESFGFFLLLTLAPPTLTLPQRGGNKVAGWDLELQAPPAPSPLQG